MPYARLEETEEAECRKAINGNCKESVEIMQVVLIS